jgi:hypothetical protein
LFIPFAYNNYKTITAKKLEIQMFQPKPHKLGIFLAAVEDVVVEDKFIVWRLLMEVG